MRERWLVWRNTRLMDPRFQQWASRNWFTRRIARKRAAQVFDLVAGFAYSQILLACVQANLFKLLAQGPKHKSWLANQMQMTIEASEVLLDAATALKLLERRKDGFFTLGELGAPLVNNEPVIAMIQHHHALYADLAEPLGLLRQRSFESNLARYWPYSPAAQSVAGADDGALTEQVASYSGLMAASQPFVANEVLRSVAFGGVNEVLDVGGGQGKFLLRLAQAEPSLRLCLFDLPPVAKRATKAFEDAGIDARCRALGGSFLDQELPQSLDGRGFDLVTLLRVIHDHDDPQAVQILKAVHRALAVNGRLVLAEPMAETPGAERMGHAYFGFYLWAMGRGRSRSAERLTEMLLMAGFVAVQELPSQIPLQARILQASKK